MTSRKAAFAVPGDIKTLTGGYIYDRTLFDGLRAAGREMALVGLGTTFPVPTEPDMTDAAKKLHDLPADYPVIIDGLAFGALDRDLVAGITAPIVAMIHHPLAYESGISETEKTRLFALERDNLTHAAHILAPSPHTKQMLTEHYGVSPDRITIARPGTKKPQTAAKPVDPPLILSVGIQVPRKGHDVLLTALAQIKDHDWQAVIAGGIQNDAHASELSRLVQKLDLSDRVRLAGRVPRAELARLYSEATIFALATRYEGYGIVFDEAMAHGLPIVTCNVGAVPDTVAPDAGRLVPPDDPTAFADALQNLLTEHNLRSDMSAASAKAGAALPTWDATVALVDDVLNRVTPAP